MRIFGLAFVLLGAFLSLARAQIPPTDPGDYLLHAVKAVADSGRPDDPATVAALLHLPFSETSHSVWSCPAGGDRIDDNYAVTGSDWFHPLPTGEQHMIIQVPFQVGDVPIRAPRPPSWGKPTQTVLGDPDIGYSSTGTLRCHDLNQNQLYVSLTFNNIPAYACISEAQIKAVFPEAGPPPPDPYPFHPPSPEFVYSNAGTLVQFQMSLYPGVADPHHQPVCLMGMSINGKFQYGPLHKFDVSFTPPVASAAGVISPRARRTPPAIPGTYLLHVVKAVTDGGRADDPAIVANLLHASLTPVDYENDSVTSCPDTHVMQGHVSLDYLITGNTWFRALPTGKRVLVKGFATIFAIKLTNIPLGDPTLSYSIAGQVACTKSSSDGVGAQITFDNIPPYACISTAQIKSFFPGAFHPTSLPRWAIADLRYSNADSNVDFTMTTSTFPGAPAHQPVCLKEINIGASYPWGGVHKLDVGT